MSDQMLSVPEACRRLGIGRSLLYELIRYNRIRSITIGKRRLIPESGVREFLAEQEFKSLTK